MRIVLFAFAFGTGVLQTMPVLPGLPHLWLIAAAAAAAAAVLGTGVAQSTDATRRAGAWAVLAAAGLLIGFAHAAWRAEQRLADQLPEAWEGEDITVIGVIDELPTSTERGWRFVLAVERVSTPGAQVPERVSVSWQRAPFHGAPEVAIPVVRAGERWQLPLRLRRPYGLVNPHGFDVEAWLLGQGIRATGHVVARADSHRVDAFAGRPIDYIHRTRQLARERIEAALAGRPYAGVIVALVIGDQRSIPAPQWVLFNRTGIGHLLSISGLHVTMFATGVGGVFFFLWRRARRLCLACPAQRAAATAGVLASGLYVLLAGAEVPAQRTFYMLAAVAIGLWFSRRAGAFGIWLAALATVLVIDPWAVLAAGFWLSFGAVGVILFAGSGRLGPIPGLASAMHTQAVVTVGLVPLSLALFQQISLISPIANAVAIPAVTLAVVPMAMLGSVVGADWLLAGSHAAFQLVAWILEPMAESAAAVWEQHAPSRLAVLLASLGILLLVCPRGVPGRWLAVLWMLPLAVLPAPALAHGEMRLTVLDVGQGLAVVVQTRSHVLVYDTGPPFSAFADTGGRVIVPYLRAAGITRLGGLVVSHQDNDHSGGAESLLAALPVDWVATSMPAGHPLLEYRAATGEEAIRCVAGQQWDWDGVRFEVLHPVADDYTAKRKTNDRSCVVRVSANAGKALLTGDVEARSEAAMLDRGVPLRADVVLVPHHGSRTSSTPGFVAATAGRYAVVTSGFRNRFGHPRPEILRRYSDAGLRVVRTDLDGALVFEFRVDGLDPPQRWRAVDRRYWRRAPDAAESDRMLE